ncbi:MAG: hypothetical protein UD936_10705 [Acutalibacteraceae bacterium]|nr:hypothetical protein [Acutalibacteraceae bacterium]
MTNVKMNLKKLPVVFLTMVILATAFVVTGCGKTVIDVEEAKLLDVEIKGFDGKGRVNLTVDEKKLKTLKKEYRDDKNYSDIKDFLDSISFVMEDESLNGKLSNGDVFNIVVTYNEDIAEDINIGVKNELISYEIKKGKLKKGTEIDAFKGLKITYSGDNTEASASTDKSGCDPLVSEAGIYFTVESENNGKLKNGDKIVVKATSDNNLEEMGYFLKEETKECIVSGLAGARETLEGVDFKSMADEMLAEVNSKTEDKYDIAWDLDYTFKSGKNRDLDTINFNYIKDVELVNYAYICNPDDFKTQNRLVAFYKLTVDAECVHNQTAIGEKANYDLMNKGETDTGVCYLAIKTNKAVKVTADNKIALDNMRYTFAHGLTLEDVTKELKLDSSYTSIEYYDAEFKKSDKPAATEEATEPATEAATEAATEGATENATTEPATEAATEAKKESATEKAE